MEEIAVAIVSDESKKAAHAKDELIKKYRFLPANDPSVKVLLVLGGDGFMLHSMHRFMLSGVSFFGMNCGSVGFLLNHFRLENLMERIKHAKHETLYPLKMQAKDTSGNRYDALAINEVSLLRETRQAAHLRVCVDEKERIEQLVCDGILVSTSAGSTAYNLSVRGPIIPLDAQLLAMTPISPFRPRRWNGALLPHKAYIELFVMDASKRPVSAVADYTEFRDIVYVEIEEARENPIDLLYDQNHSLKDRVIAEQFVF